MNKKILQGGLLGIGLILLVIVIADMNHKNMEYEESKPIKGEIRIVYTCAEFEVDENDDSKMWCTKIERQSR